MVRNRCVPVICVDGITFQSLDGGLTWNQLNKRSPQRLRVGGRPAPPDCRVKYSSEQEHRNRTGYVATFGVFQIPAIRHTGKKLITRDSCRRQWRRKRVCLLFRDTIGQNHSLWVQSPQPAYRIRRLGFGHRHRSLGYIRKRQSIQFDPRKPARADPPPAPRSITSATASTLGCSRPATPLAAATRPPL